MGFSSGSDGKKICLQCKRPGFDPWVGKIPWRRKWLPAPVSCLENSMDRGACQAVCSSWSHKELDTTKRLTLNTNLTECVYVSPNLPIFLPPKMFSILIGVLVKREYTFVKIHLTIHLKSAHIILVNYATVQKKDVYVYKTCKKLWSKPKLMSLKAFLRYFPGSPVVKNPPCNVGDPGSIPRN